MKGGLRRFAAALPTLLCLSLAALAAVIFLWIALSRISYPYDLEWMEGGMLCHALRLFQGRPIYAPPSVDFIPHLYTPLYPALLSTLGRLTGDVGYGAARALSLLSFLCAIAVGTWLVAREGGDRLLGAAALGLPLAAFPLTGGFYDLARSDSLQLFLTVLGAAVAFHGRARHSLVALSALVLVFAFFAKQTAAPLVAAVGLALLGTRRRPVWTLAIVGCGAFALIAFLLNRFSGGWFWIYIFRLHQSHQFFARRAFVETPLLLLRALGPALLLVPLSLLVRPRPPALLYLAWLGLVGAFAACLSFGTEWAHVNAYTPGVFFPALAIGAGAAHLAARGSIWRGAAAALLSFSLCSLLVQGYGAAGPRSHVPSAMDRQRGDALVARLRAAPGEVLIPFHPFYGHLAGKRTFLHRMGVWDVRGTVAGPVRGLDEALRAARFSLIVFDDKVEWSWQDWPGVLTSYDIALRVSGPRVVEGARTVPSLVLLPKPKPIDQEIQ